MCCGKGLDKFQFFSRRTGFVLFSLIPYTCLSVAAGQPDSLSRQLEELEVTAPGRKIVNRNEWGDRTLDVRALGRYVRTLGEADPVKQIQMLPGVHVSDDYASGFSVEGASYSQSLVEIDSAPLFSPIISAEFFRWSILRISKRSSSNVFFRPMPPPHVWVHRSPRHLRFVIPVGWQDLFPWE